MKVTLADGSIKILVPPKNGQQNDNGIMIVEKDNGDIIIARKWVFHPTKGWRGNRILLKRNIDAPVDAPVFRRDNPLEIEI